MRSLSRPHSIFICGIAGVVGAVFYCFYGDPRVGRPPALPAGNEKNEKMVESLEEYRALTPTFEVAAEQRENVEFIAVPALLLQEALDSNTIITYPQK